MPKFANNKQQFINGLSGGVHTKVSVPEELIRNKNSYSIYYRGDSRPPERIFVDGFQPWEAGHMFYRIDKQDIDPRTAIALSREFDVAALCPLLFDRNKLLPNQRGDYRLPPKKTYVYLVMQTAVFNTARTQARFAAKTIPDSSIEHTKQSEQNLYADEVAVRRVLNEDVIAAIEIERKWAGRDFMAGGSYHFIDYFINRARKVEHNSIVNGLFNNTANRNMTFLGIMTHCGATGNLATADNRNARVNRYVNKYQERLQLIRNEEKEEDDDNLLGFLPL